MKQDLKRLTAILKLFDIEDFYVLTVRSSEVVLQGEFKADIARKAMILKFKQSIEPRGYLNFNRGNYTIILT